MEDGAIDAVVRHVTRPDRACGMRTSSCRVAFDGTMQPGRSTERAQRVAARKKRALDHGVQLGSVKNVASCTVTTVGSRPQRLGVVRAVQDVGPDATSHAEQAGLFPAQPNRTTVEHARAGDDLEAERLVAHPVGWLARDDDLGPRAG